MVFLFNVVPRFFAWWRASLIECLPGRLCGLFRRRRPLLVVAWADESLRLRMRKGDRWRELGPIPFQPANPFGMRQAVAAATRDMRLRGAEIVVELPAHQVLRRVVELPMAAVENLREVLSFEMDRHTPLKAEDAAFDYRVITTDPAAKRVAVDVAVVQRTLVERACALAESLGLTPQRIGIGADDEDARQPLNLLPPAERSAGIAVARSLSIFLALAVCALGIGAVYLPLYFKGRVLAAYEARLEGSRAAAVEADFLSQQVAAALERTQFLVERRLSTPTTAALLNELTILLPDDTWLIELHWRGNQLSFSGFSPRAASLIASIEESSMISEVRFASPVTTDPKIGRERFNLSAVVAGGPDD